jgi:DNA adenine methylase
MKTPISYYGGKQRLVPEILPLFPEHEQYVEPFTGGGAVFFSKNKIANEVINDLDGRIVNFYRVIQTKEKFLKLQEMVRATLHAESEHIRAAKILKAPMVDEIEFAWAFWVQTNMSFSFIIFGGFAFGNCTRSGRNSKNKRESFDDRYHKRLEFTEIFCRDAIDLIDLKDTENTFFYCDPPYVSSDCGHYKGYTMENFEALLDRLTKIKGKFLLSSYPEEVLMKYREKHGWKSKDIHGFVSVDGNREIPKFKTECLTWNYELKKTQLEMFGNDN